MSSGSSSSISMAESMADAEAGSEVTQLAVCDHQSTGSKYPSFSKAIGSPYMQDFRLELPATFVKEHGHNFQATINLQGPSGNTEKPIRLRIQSLGQDRVYFRGAEWRRFVLENGFRVGDELSFSLVSDSTFIVHPVANPAPQTSTPPRTAPEIGSETPKNAAETGSKTASESAPKAGLGTASKACSSSTVGRPPDYEPYGNIHGEYEVVYACRSVRFRREVEMLVESCLEKLQCPHFVTVMTKSHLRDNRSSAVCVPVKFLKKYSMYFAEVHRFQGPSERVMEVSFCSGRKKARFTAGWTAFRRENGFKLGDVLLFSLRAPSQWFVQVVLEQFTNAGESNVTPKVSGNRKFAVETRKVTFNR